MSVSKIGTYAFYNHPNLETVKTGAKTVEANAFQNAKKLNVIDLTSASAVTIAANAFNGCSAAEHLVIRSTDLSTLSNVSALSGTKIARGEGGIYVQEALLDSYKARTNFVTYKNNIFPLGEYPRANFASVSDSWEKIIANENYKNDYSVGDTVILELTDGTELYINFAGFDLDTKSDGSGKARMSMICKGIYTTRQMNTSANTSGGWGAMPIRTWLQSEVLGKFPDVVKNAIVPVDKTYRCKSPNDETLTISDTLWIPSYKEVGFTNATYVESEGVVYSGLFPNQSSLVKYNTSGSANYWWLRSAYNSAGFRCVGSGGYESNSGASIAYGVVFGFCI